MKVCELCRRLARIYCDADQASLCWDCDDKVHSANFLVARHSRSLLCRACQSPMPWAAAGTKLYPTMSLCSGCSGNLEGKDDDDVDDDEEEDAESQVVPISSSTPPPPAECSSTSEGGSMLFPSSETPSSKRTCEDADLDPNDNSGCSSFALDHNAGSCAEEANSRRQCKQLRTTEPIRSGNHDGGGGGSTSTAIIRSIKWLQENSISGDGAS